MNYNEIEEFAGRIESAGKSGIIVVAGCEDADVKFVLNQNLSDEEALVVFVNTIASVIASASESLGTPPQVVCQTVCELLDDGLLEGEEPPAPVLC